MATKQRTTHIRDPWNTNVKVRHFEQGFDLTIESPKQKIVAHFEADYWLEHLADELWKVLKRRRQQLETGEAAMKGGA